MPWDTMQDQWKREALATDKQDLLGLLCMRFGDVPADAAEFIANMTDGDALERLIVVAANVPSWTAFVSELAASGSAFRIVGSQYQPY